MKNLWMPPVAIGALILAGCAPAPSETPAANTTPNEKPKTAVSGPGPVTGQLKVALLTPGPVSDAGWSAMAFQGLKGIKAKFNAEVSNEEASGGKIRDALRSYAQEGYNLVIGHGFEYNEPSVEIAKDFPNTVFVSSSGGGTAPNAGAFRFYLEQGFYLAGAMAGSMSKSGKIATVAIGGIPSIDSTLKAFVAGAKAAKPTIEVIEIKIESDKDVAAAKRSTAEAIKQGADFVIHQANAAAQGVFDACKEGNALAFGANLDQNENSSGIVVASAYIDAKPAFMDLAEKVMKGEYTGAVTLYGMDKGAIQFKVNPALAGKVTPEAMTLVEQMRADMISGKLVAPKDDF